MLGRWLSRGIISCNISQQQPLCILRMGIYFIISAHLFLPDQYKAKVLISSYHPLLESITHFKAYHQSCSLWDPSTTAVNDTVGPAQLWVMLMKLVDNAPKAWILLKSNPIDFKKMKERKKKILRQSSVLQLLLLPYSATFSGHFPSLSAFMVLDF